MFNHIGWSHFLTLYHPTYERLTLEFLKSFKYMYPTRFHQGFAKTTFRQVNREFDFIHLSSAYSGSG